MDHRKRTLKLGERVAVKDNVDCVVLTSTPNLKYFFDYSGESFERFCCGLLTRDGSKCALVVPALDRAKAEKSAADGIYPWSDAEGYSNALNSAVKNLGIHGGTIGVELSITMAQMDSLRSSIGASNFVGITEETSSLRLIKDEEEIESVKRTARMLSRAYRNISDFLRRGETEVGAAFEIKQFLSAKGAEGVDFCAVQSGRNSAIPHAQPGRKRMEKGDTVVVDVSCTNRDGYFADFTRTFVIGKASKKQNQIHSIVKNAQAEGFNVAKAGTMAKEVDNAARSVIETAGYGEYFFHRTGHGLGLEVHEPPWIRGDNEQVLERGMIFTVEPGIYLSGSFGVRIEDNLIVGKNRADNITPLSHELIEI